MRTNTYEWNGYSELFHGNTMVENNNVCQVPSSQTDVNFRHILTFFRNGELQKSLNGCFSMQDEAIREILFWASWIKYSEMVCVLGVPWEAIKALQNIHVKRHIFFLLQSFFNYLLLPGTRTWPEKSKLFLLMPWDCSIHILYKQDTGRVILNISMLSDIVSNITGIFLD